MSLLTDRITELIPQGRPRIAFGLAEQEPEVLASLRKSEKYADIILVATPEVAGGISGFTVEKSDNPEWKLVEMLANDEVDGIIRGTVDEFVAYEKYQELTGEKSIIKPALMEDTQGRQYFLSPTGNPEGWLREDRLRIALGISEFMEQWGLEPDVAIFTGVRHDSYKRRKQTKDKVQRTLNVTYEDAEWIVSKLKQNKIKATNWTIELDRAVDAGCNVLVPVNGMVGNQVFRAIMLSGGKMLAAPRIGLSRKYEENSRTEKDFESHVRWLVAWINSANST